MMHGNSGGLLELKENSEILPLVMVNIMLMEINIRGSVVCKPMLDLTKIRLPQTAWPGEMLIRIPL